MHGRLYDFFEKDHRRIEDLLNRATIHEGEFDLKKYGLFRAALLRHIGLEERILFPAAQSARSGEPFPAFPKIRLDHGALTALMVPPPTPSIVATIRKILTEHDALEESNGGPYDACEQLAAERIDELLDTLKRAPEVRILPHRDEPFVLEATKRAVERAGYKL